MVNMFARCAQENDYNVKINKGKLPPDWGPYNVHVTLKGNVCILQTECPTSELV